MSRLTLVNASRDADTRLEFIRLLEEMRRLAIHGRLPQPFVHGVCQRLAPVVLSMRKASGVDIGDDGEAIRRAEIVRLHSPAPRPKPMTWRRWLRVVLVGTEVA